MNHAQEQSIATVADRYAAKVAARYEALVADGRENEANDVFDAPAR